MASKQLLIFCIVTGLYSLFLRMCLYIVELVFIDFLIRLMFKSISDHIMPLYKIKI